MERKWYYAVGGVRHGPVTFEELREIVRSGAVSPADLVWQPDFGPEWRTVGQVQALFGVPAETQAPVFVRTLRPDVTLLGVEGNRPSCLAALSQAYGRVVDVLFRPFDMTRWFSMGFCAWLAYLGTQSGNFNGIGKEENPELVKQQLDGFLDKLSHALANPGAATAAVVFVLAVLLVSLLLCAVRSRGDFMFIRRWYQPDASVAQCWKSSREAGRALFVWRIYFFLAAFLVFAVDAWLAYQSILRPYLDAGHLWEPTLVKPAVLCLTVFALWSIGVELVGHLTKAFVVPVMYWQNVSVGRAWQVVFELCNQYPFAVLGYLVCGLACGMAAVCAVLLCVLLTCCIGLIPLVIPYVGSVVMLPIYLFFRGYSVCFISQWRSELVSEK